MYSLHQVGFYTWWHFAYDPCSLYADDGTLFLQDRSQLSGIIKHIQMVGKFTGLVLNLDKTIVFDHAQLAPVYVSGMLCQNTLIKYLGIYVGLGNLTKLNFDVVLKKVQQIILKWSKCKLSLPARVMVSKVFIFSTFVHVCNYAWISNDQIKLIQHILNNFVWNR